MIGFQHPLVLLLALPWWLGWLAFARLQRRALGWVEDHVAPRFRRQLTAHDGRSLRWHLRLLLVMGLVLVVAAAGPVARGGGETAGTEGELLLVIDASASMQASDVAAPETEVPKNRLELARAIALGVVDRLDGYRFAVASFSGTPAFHLPMTPDRELTRSALEVLEVHTFYRNSGSSLTHALDSALHFVDEERPGLQVLILGDGELPFPESYDTPLAALVEQRVPVHSVAVGTLAGQGRLIYDFRDVVAGKEPEERRVLREYTTRRVDEHLERIARSTGGRFLVAEGAGSDSSESGSAERLADEVAATIEGLRAAGLPGRSEEAGRDLAHLPLGLFLLAFLVDALVIGRRQAPRPPAFDLASLGSGRSPARSRQPGGGSALAVAGALALGAVLLAARPAGPADPPELLAHQANEEGIGLDTEGRHDDARVHYQRSIGVGVLPEIPTYNLARSLTLAGDYTEAHDLYQETLELRPDLVEAHFNDGVALFLWGRSARDPGDCDLERTRELWQAARGRFADAAELAEPGSSLAGGARSNLRFVGAELEAVERLIAEPPEHCRGNASESESDQGGGGGGGESEAEAGGGGGGGEGDGGAEDRGPEESEADGQGGGSGPLGASEHEQVEAAFERLREQGRQEGKFHRRTGPEQFPEEVWGAPDDEIWW